MSEPRDSQLSPVRDLDRRKIYRELSRRHDLLISQVEEIVESQFQFLADTIAKGDHEAVRLPFLGLFHVKPGRIKHIDAMKNKNKK